MDARIYTTSYKDGVPGFRLVVVCCGPDAPLPNPVEWMRTVMVVHYADDELPIPICTIDRPHIRHVGTVRVTYNPVRVTCSECIALMKGKNESQNILRNSDENADRFFSERGRPVDPRPSTSFSRPVSENFAEGIERARVGFSKYAESASEDESDNVQGLATQLAERCGCRRPDVHEAVARARIEIQAERKGDES